MTFTHGRKQLSRMPLTNYPEWKNTKCTTSSGRIGCGLIGFMRRASKIDTNQPQIVDALRKMGCSVQLLHKQGQGCPDLLIGHKGRNLLAEVKDGALSPSRRTLTEDQIEWHEAWRGQVAIIENVDQAKRLIDDLL